MRKPGIVAATVTILTLALISAGCGEATTEATRWVTVVDDVQPFNSSDSDSKITVPFKLTGAPCRLRYETVNAFVLHVYIAPGAEPTKRQSVLDRRDSPRNGQTVVSVEPGIYCLEIEGVSMCYSYHLWLEEQR